jgi:serine/threonine protein phosphatase PrpC/heme exporter protein D
MFESMKEHLVLYVALVIVLLVLAVLIVDTVMRYKRKKARAERKRAKRRQKEAAEKTASVNPAPAGEVTVIGNIADVPKAPVSAAYFQDIGARDDQQDSYGMTDISQYSQYGVMAVVADGMGGLANGKAVSSALVRTFVEGFGVVAAYPKCSDALLDLAIRANEQINRMLQGQERSGSTLVTALVKNGLLYFITVGDSRLYLYRGGALLQLNREHIYQEELAVKAVNRQVSIQQVSGDRQSQSLTSYFGIGKIPCVDRNHEGIKLLPGDRLLLSSDGVFGTLSVEQMEQALSLPLQEAAQTMGRMVREAEKPYQDNNTGLILEYQG